MKTTAPLAGKLLSAEQSIRLTLMDNCDRDQAIALIVTHLRRANTTRMGVGKFPPRTTPQEWYAMPVG